MSDKKPFIYYCGISVSKGLNTELKTSELCLERYDKKVYKNCGHCHQVTEINKNFKEDPNTCDMCFILLQKGDKINPTIHIIWKENTKYRVYTNLHRLYTDHIFRREPIKAKTGEISNETIDLYLNSLI